MEDRRDTFGDNASYIRPIIKKITEWITSEASQKLAINSIVFGSVFSTLTTAAIIIYAIFYALYLPKSSHRLPLYIDYGNMAGTVDMAHHEFSIKPDQVYNFGVEMTVPDSENNFKLGKVI